MIKKHLHQKNNIIKSVLCFLKKWDTLCKIKYKIIKELNFG